MTGTGAGAYYGWFVVAGLSITETVSSGILSYGFPVMLRPMEADLGFSRVEITTAPTRVRDECASVKGRARAGPDEVG